MNRKLRGIRILKRREDRKVSLKLLQVNDTIYVVAYRIIILGLIYRKKRFEFEDFQAAEHFYNRVVHKLFPSPWESSQS